MVLDPCVRVQLLQGQVHSLLEAFRKFIVVVLLCIGAKEQGSNAEEQQQSSHLSPRVCDCEGEWAGRRTSHLSVVLLSRREHPALFLLGAENSLETLFQALIVFT